MRKAILPLMLVVLAILAGCSNSSLPAAHSTDSTAICQPLPNGKGPFTYVAMGASDAVGIGATCENTLAYVPLLSQKMPKGTDTVNLGISGETLDHALVDELPQAIASKPHIITIWLVANDFKAMLASGKPTLLTYSQELTTLLSSLRQRTNAKIYMANLPDMTKLPAIQHMAKSLSLVSQENIQWNTAISQIAAQYQTTLVDVYAQPLQPNMLFLDGFHPNNLGYQLLAAAFWQAIQANGGPSA